MEQTPPNIPLGFAFHQPPTTNPVCKVPTPISPEEALANANKTQVEATVQQQDADMERLVTLANIFQGALYHPTNEDTGQVSEHPYWDNIDLGSIKEKYREFLLNLPTK